MITAQDASARRLEVGERIRLGRNRREMMDRMTQMENDHLDPDKHLPPEMPIVEDAVAGKDLTCPGCGGTADWWQDITTTDQGHLADEFIEYDAGWLCGCCEWAQECTNEDVGRKT